MTKRVPEKEKILKYITEQNVVELAKSLISFERRAYE